MLRIITGGLDDTRVQRLLEHHVRTARSETAAGSAHALDLGGLRSPDVTFWSAWEGGSLVGVGALKRLSPTHGEIKSMHTDEGARRRGVGTVILRHIVAAAREQGMTRLSLETGSWPYFEPARALYRKHGFVECPPFGDYVPDPNSVFMTRVVSGTAGVYELVHFNLARARAPLDQPVMAGFAAALDEVQAAAVASPGFIWTPAAGEAGDAAAVFGSPLALANISTWRSIDDLRGYVYEGLHGRALARRREWFEAPRGSAYALWWVRPEHRPGWAEAKRRLDHLNAHGSTTVAFTFHSPFGPPEHGELEC